MATTTSTRTTTPTGSGLAPITINRIDVGGEEEAYKIAEDLRKLQDVQTYVETLADALRARIINQLRAEGMDAAGRNFVLFQGAGTAEQTANRVVQPLRAMAAELDNSARNAHVFRNRIQSLVFDAIREARRMKTNPSSNGLVVK